MPRIDRLTDLAARLVLILSIALAVWATASVIFDPSKSFVHPTYLDSILPRASATGFWPHWFDFLNAILQFGPEESRPRFLALLIEFYDQKIRLALHRVVPLPPTFMLLSWTLELVVGPYFLYRLIRNLGGQWIATGSAVAVYVTTIGVLSGVAMNFIPGKGLVTVTLIIAMHALSSIQKDGIPAKFSDGKLGAIVTALVTVLAGLFLDEVGTFAFVLLPIMFWPLFLDPAGRTIAEKFDWKGIAICAIPAVVFLISVAVVIPYIYRIFFNQPFDYFGNVFAVGVGSLGAKSVFVGPHGTFGPYFIWTNFANFFGLSTVPVQISPFTTTSPIDVGIVQTHNVWQLVGIGALFVAAIGCSFARSKPARSLRWVLLTTAVFVVLMTLLSIRHNPIIIGYYYGASISLFIALVVGLAVGVVEEKGLYWRLGGAVAAFLIVVVQVNNFPYVNSRWRILHNEHATRPANEKRLRLLPLDTEVTAQELAAIRSAWKAGELESYLKANAISAGAIYLVYELRVVDQIRARSR